MRSTSLPDVPLLSLVRDLGKKDYVGYQWVRKNWIQVTTRGQLKFVSAYIAAQIIQQWRHTCTIPEAAAETGATKHWIRHAVRKKQIKRIKVLGYMRIVRSELPQAKKLWREAQKDLAFPEKNGLARYSPEKRRELSAKAHAVMIATGRSRGPITPRERAAASERMKRLHREGRIPYMTSSTAKSLAYRSVEKRRQSQATRKKRSNSQPQQSKD